MKRNLTLFVVVPFLIVGGKVWAGAESTADTGTVEIPARVLHDKIRGGLLGQLLGDLNGLKHEMKYIEEPGNVQQYTPALPDGAWTDDDTDFEWVYLKAMQEGGPMEIPYDRISQLWKTHINRMIWCSNQFARQLMDIDIEPPLTGQPFFNPWADFNISGQFLSESFALISPGMPQAAARLGVHYTQVAISGEPAQTTQLFDAMIATAFFTENIQTILDAGVSALDARSRIREIVSDVRLWWQQQPQDWRATRRLVKQKYSRYQGGMRDRNGYELNTASVIGALLYGEGDFIKTLVTAFNFGWDADNNAATAGTVIGVIKGVRWMKDQGWNIQDRYRNTSRDQMPADETITRFGDRLTELAERVIVENGGSKLVLNGEAVYRIRRQQPVNIQALQDPAKEFKMQRSRFKAPLGKTVADDKNPKALARAAYLAICLDLARNLQSHYPSQWSQALAALNQYPKVVQVLFYESPVSEGDLLRTRALAAGLEKPLKREKIW